MYQNNSKREKVTSQSSSAEVGKGMDVQLAVHDLHLPFLMSEPIAGSSHCELIFYKCRSNNRARKWALYRVRSSPVSRTATTGESCICNAMHSYFTHTLLGIDLPVSFNFKQVQVRSGPRTPKEGKKSLIPNQRSGWRIRISELSSSQLFRLLPGMTGINRTSVFQNWQL